jgi:type I restriction enzyme S subunit
MSKLPKGWGLARLEDVCELINGRAYKQAELLNRGRYPVLRVGNFFSNRSWYYSDLELEDDKYCDRGDLLYAWSASFGPRIWDGGKAIFHYHIWKTQLNELAIAKRYLYHWFEWDKENIKSEHGTGSTMIHVTKGDMEDRSIGLPPLSEQQRIVAKIDSLTGKSGRAREQLDHIPRLVEKYKQAVLAAAFRGDLTRAWRIEREQHEPWREALLGDVSDIQSGIALGKKRSPGALLIRRPYLRVANVQRGWLNLDEVKNIEVTAAEADRLYLRAGDILMNEGGDRDKLGRGWVWEGQIANCIHQNHVFRVRLFDNAFPPKLVSLYANEFGQRHFFDEGTQTTNLASISKMKLSSLPICLPPVNEAVELLRRIETAFAWIDRLAAEATSASKLVNRLDQAVLAKAFRGELVFQDPADEPATVLLERIRAERGAATKGKRGRKAKAA